MFAVKLSRPYKLIDRYEYELTEEDAQKLIPINKAQHYKRIKPGMKVSSAVYALFESSGIHDTWKTVLKLLGYDGIVYANVQYALIDDEIPFSSYDDMQMSEERKNNVIKSIKEWEEQKAKRKELADAELKKRDDKVKTEQEESVSASLAYCVDLFVKLAGLKETLDSIGLSDEIKSFILSQPKENIQYYVAAVRKNPAITMQQLQEALPEKKETVDPYLEHEHNIAQRSGDMKNWVLISMRKLRQGKKVGNVPGSRELPWPQTYRLFYNKLPEIKDWFESERPDLASYTAEQAMAASDKWHKEMAEKGTGHKYQEGSENVVYGPKWHNQVFNGWTIRKVTTENDLEVEGNKMNHCVGGYCENVESGKSIIYSLRDPQNEPHVTLEADDRNINFEQIKGHSNSEPKQEYKNMIKEWFQSLMKSGKKITVGEGEDINDRIYEAVQSTRYTTKRDFGENLEKVLSNENDYGIPGNNEGYSFETCYKSILGVFNNRDSSYYSYMSGAAGSLVRLAIEEDNRLAAKYDDMLKQTPKQYPSLLDISKLWKKNSEIESIVNKTQENSEDMFSDVIDYYPPMPEESDFGPEGEDDYKQALKNYESEIEHIDSQARSYLPYAFDDDLMEELNKQLESNPVRLRPWMKDSTVWYYSKNKNKNKKKSA